MKNIYRIMLIGYMGCGKTTVGKILSKDLGFSYIDMDSEIERIEGSSVKKIFMRYGEHEFRNKESELLDKLCNISSGIDIMTGGHGAIKKMSLASSKYSEFENLGQDKKNAIVVSCGGGIILDDLNCRVLKKEFTVFLRGPLPILFHRISTDDQRPLAFWELTDEAKRFDKFKNLYETREVAYMNSACLTIDITKTDGSIKTPEELSLEICNFLL